MEKGFLNSPTDANSISMANINLNNYSSRYYMPAYSPSGGSLPMPATTCGCGGQKAIQPPLLNNLPQQRVQRLVAANPGIYPPTTNNFQGKAPGYTPWK